MRRAETDYGWLALDAQPARWCGVARAVGAFHEKPAFDVATRLWESGALWNTLILTARTDTVWQALVTTEPTLAEAVGGLADIVSPPSSAFRAMPHRDFSKDVLERGSVPLRIPLFGVQWSDWGRPERILKTLRAVGSPTAHLAWDDASPTAQRTVGAPRKRFAHAEICRGVFWRATMTPPIADLPR